MTSVGPRSGSFDEGVLLVFEETRVCEREEGDRPVERAEEGPDGLRVCVHALCAWML